MSKLIEKLENIVKGTPQAIGFRAIRAEAAKSRMVLIASLDDNIKNLKDYLAGADAVLLTRVGKSAASLPEIPWGSRLSDTSEKAVAGLVESGADFVVFPADSVVLDLGKDSKLGKVLQVETSLSDSLLRTVSQLPVDAVLVDIGEKKELSWNDLMALQRFAVNKPLLVAVAPDLTPGGLKAVWDAGSDGIVVTISADLPADTLAKLREEIGKLAPRAKKPGKTEALLPFAKAKPEAEPEPEYEEEEEE